MTERRRQEMSGWVRRVGLSAWLDAVLPLLLRRLHPAATTTTTITTTTGNSGRSISGGGGDGGPAEEAAAALVRAAGDVLPPLVVAHAVVDPLLAVRPPCVCGKNLIHFEF